MRLSPQFYVPNCKSSIALAESMTAAVGLPNTGPAFVKIKKDGIKPSFALVRVFLRHLFKKVSNIKGLRAVKKRYLPLKIE
jgi:hypothetical protein